MITIRRKTIIKLIQIVDLIYPLIYRFVA